MWTEACRICGQPGECYAGIGQTCKECHKARAKAYREANIERIREYDRNRPNRAERSRENRRRYREAVKDDDKRAEMWANSKKWRERNQEKRRAHTIVGNAIRAGTLKPQPCEQCGFALGVDAHHEDYSKPLDVVWLCRQCHMARHREINEERRRAAG